MSKEISHEPKGVDDAIKSGATLRRISGDAEAALLEEQAEALGLSLADEKPKKERFNHFQPLKEVAEQGHEFFSCAGQAYASPGDGLAYEIDSHALKESLILAYYDSRGMAAPRDTLVQILDLKSAEVKRRGPHAKVKRRSAQHEGDLYLDPGREDGKVFRVHRGGVELCNCPPGLYFLRSGATEDRLPDPIDSSDSLEALLARLTRLKPHHIRLAIAWMLSALRPGVPCPILVVEGPAGSGKSSVAKVLKYLIDPCPKEVLLRAFPGNERDFAVTAHNSHVLAFDNLDKVSPATSDMLCRASTGGAFSSRTNYTMTGETTIPIQKPIILTGIEGLVERADLADRTILLSLERVPPEEVRTEEALWEEAARLRPQILGKLLGALSAALKGIDSVRPAKLHRMADFQAWSMAAEEALPWPPGGIMEAYEAARKEVYAAALGQDRVAYALVEFFRAEAARGERSWEGTAETLLERLRPPFGGDDCGWPQKPNKLGARITKADTILRAHGYHVGRGWRGSKRVFRAEFPEQVSENAEIEELESVSGGSKGAGTGPLPTIPHNGTDDTDDRVRLIVGEQTRMNTGPPTIPTIPTILSNFQREEEYIEAPPSPRAPLAATEREGRRRYED